jgi:hypothetical protein
MPLTREEYQKQAMALESGLNDTRKTVIPLEPIFHMIMAGNVLDLTKRWAFYTKKPSDNTVQEVAKHLDNVKGRLREIGFKGFHQSGISHRLIHACLGLATEVAEIWEALVEAMATGKPVDLDNLREESGDLCWYQALLRDECEQLDGNQGRFTQESIQAANLAKLHVRYGRDNPQGYGADRDTAAEQAAMNGVK